MRHARNNILITGGAGFIGSALVLALQNSYNITCFGRGTGFAKLKKLANKNVTFVRGDMSDEAVLHRCIKGVDYVVHLAGGGGNAACVNDPAWALATHVASTRAIAKLAAAHKVKKFIFASSYHVYGSPRSGVVAESAQPKPEIFYANLKLLAEQVITDSGGNYAILRFGNVYGYSSTHPFQEAGAIDNFIGACLLGKSMLVQGTGSQTIDYLHIQDAVAAIVAALKKGSKKSVYNIGSGQTVTVKKLANIIQRAYQAVCGSRTPIRQTGHAGNAGAVRMSIAKAERELGWNPSIDLKTGIVELIRKNL